MYPLSATTVCGAKFWQLLLCRTVIDFGASSHLAPALLSSSHFLRDPVKVRRGRNVNRGRFHRTMGRSRTIRLNVETATRSVPCCSWSLAKASSKHPKTDQSCTFLQLGLERIKTHQTENKSFKFDVFDHFKGSEEDYVSRIWLAILIHGEIEERCLGCFSPHYNCWRLGITAWKYWPFLCPVVTDHSFSNMYIE